MTSISKFVVKLENLRTKSSQAELHPNIEALLPKKLTHQNFDTDPAPTRTQKKGNEKVSPTQFLSRELFKTSRPPIEKTKTSPSPLKTTSARVSSEVHIPQTVPESKLSKSLEYSQGNTTLPAQQASTDIASLANRWIQVAHQIKNDLSENLSKINHVNRSRRLQIVQHLDRLAGFQSPFYSTSVNSSQSQSLYGSAADEDDSHLTQNDPNWNLVQQHFNRWIHSYNDPIQQQILNRYFHELSIFFIAQTLVLKRWNDTLVRPLQGDDLVRVSSRLSSILKTKIPHGMEGWQFTYNNIYSWYDCPVSIQNSIRELLKEMNLENWTAETFFELIYEVEKNLFVKPIIKDQFAAEFYIKTWDLLYTLANQFNPLDTYITKQRIHFSPTLQSNLIGRLAQINTHHIGFEDTPLKLFLAEIAQLWSGPCTPPLWSVGNGLDAHWKDQLNLLNSPRPTLLNRISEMEACDFAWVSEYQMIRTNMRNSESHRLRHQLEKLPYFKKIKGPATSLGALQAVVAVTKLRPGGLFLWAREEALGPADGNEILSFLFDRCRLLCEWDFSEVHCNESSNLPTKLTAPELAQELVLPKYLYLFVREINSQNRLTHRPLRVLTDQNSQFITPQSLPRFLECAFAQLPEIGPPLRLENEIEAHSEINSTLPTASFNFKSLLSQKTQKDWLEHWPDASENDSLLKFEKMKQEGVPLANLATIRSTPNTDSSRNFAWSVQPGWTGFWVHIDKKEGKKLACQNLPTQPEQKAHGNGLMILFPDAHWVAPIRSYCESKVIQEWMEYHAEKRAERWLLNEQVIKYIHIPRLLIEQLKKNTPIDFSFRDQLNELLSENYSDEKRKYFLNSLSSSNRAQAFIFFAQKLEKNKTDHEQLMTIIGPTSIHDHYKEESIVRWSKLIEILPKSQLVQATLHPDIELRGNLPPHLSIVRIERSKNTSPSAIHLYTDSNYHLSIISENSLLITILNDQLSKFNHPTWHELAQFLKLPRQLESTQSIANDLLQTYYQVTAEVRKMQDLLDTCLNP